MKVTICSPSSGVTRGALSSGVGPDVDQYVEAELQPNGGAWLPAGQQSCAFEFAIGASPRTTNGYGLGGGYTLDKELVGISYTP